MADEVRIGVEVDTGRSVRDVEELRDATERAGREVDELDSKTVEVPVELDVDESSVRKATGALEDIDRKGRGAADGIGFGNNALRDLTGPLGNATGGAGDFGDAFEGLGDIVGGVAGKLGASADTIGKITGVLGGVGVAVAIGVAAWNLYKRSQQQAAEEAKNLLEYQELLADRKFGDAAELLAEKYKDTIADLERFGYRATDLARILDGQGGSVNELRARYERLRAEIDAAILAGDDSTRTVALTEEATQLEKLITNLDIYAETARTSGEGFLNQQRVVQELTGYFEDTNAAATDVKETVEEINRAFDELIEGLDQQSAVESVRDAFDDVEDAAVAAWVAAAEGADDADRLARDYQQSIRDAITETLGLSEELAGIVPPEQLQAIAVALSTGDLATARKLLEEVASSVPPVRIALDQSFLQQQMTTARNEWQRTAGPGSSSGGATAPPAASTVVVNNYYPPRVSGSEVYDSLRNRGRVQGTP